MKPGRMLFLFPLVLLLLLTCSDKKNYAPWQLISPDDVDPANFVWDGFLLLDDCILLNVPEDIMAIIEYWAAEFSTVGSDNIKFATPSNLCGKVSVIDSSGTVIYDGLTESGGCIGKSYKPDGSHLPPGFVMLDTLYLGDYILNNWPAGRPEGDHVIYTRIGEDGDTTRYAFPRLCGQYLLIDEDGLPTGKHYWGVGGCAGYQEMINK